MSRYDWGGANPAIEKLKDCVEPAARRWSAIRCTASWTPWTRW